MKNMIKGNYSNQTKKTNISWKNADSQGGINTPQKPTGKPSKDTLKKYGKEDHNPKEMPNNKSGKVNKKMFNFDDKYNY